MRHRALPDATLIRGLQAARQRYPNEDPPFLSPLPPRYAGDVRSMIPYWPEFYGPSTIFLVGRFWAEGKFFWTIDLNQERFIVKVVGSKTHVWKWEAHIWMTGLEDVRAQPFAFWTVIQKPEADHKNEAQH